jgi:transcriptional regulator with XRE-family HTH domain
MSQSAALIEVLKRELKARGLTYADVAAHLDMSEASVKRMFSTRNFTLERFDEICEFAKLEITELAEKLAQSPTLLTQLSLEQERELVADMKLMLVAICCLHNLSFEQMLEAYSFSPAECVKLLTRLDKLRIIDLMPNNRAKPLVARGFTWIPGGPVQQFFFSQVTADFFRHHFGAENETVLVASGRLSRQNQAVVAQRLKKITQEFRDLHHDDLKLPIGERPVLGMIVALRGWEFEAFRKLRNTPQKPAQA